MSELLKKQKFGVEVEFTGITRTMAAEAVAEILGSHAAGPDRTCSSCHVLFSSVYKIRAASFSHPCVDQISNCQ